MAHVGLSEEEARNAGIAYEITSCNSAAVLALAKRNHNWKLRG